MQPSNFDYAYAILGIVIGIFMLLSPRTFMRGAKYDEESLKTEKLVKVMGIVLALLSMGLGLYIYLR